VAMFVTILMGTALLRALLMTEDWAGRARLTVIARAIVQRNCDAAVGVTFTGTTAMPAILNYASGSVRSDTGTTQENINVTLNAGSTAMVSGTLTQTVVDEPTPTGLVASLGTLPARRITFQIDYDYHSRHYTWAQAVVRSQDQ